MARTDDYTPMDEFSDDQLRDFLDLRLAYTLRGERDRADVVGVRVNEDGTVDTRPLTYNDLWAWLERQIAGEVGE